MAVSGKTPAPNEIPYFLGTDKPPDMAAVTKAMANQTAARLSAIAPICGRIKEDGTVSSGSGFTCEKTATGLYKITFTTPFLIEPIVVASIWGIFPKFISSSPVEGKILEQRTIATFNSAGAAANSSFQFIAMKPQ